MINKKTGSIELGADKVINQSISLEEVKSLGLGESQTERVLGYGWVWYDVRNIKIADHYFVISFAFYNNKLNILDFVFSSSKYETTNSWTSWGEKDELQKALIFNNWLCSEVGSERTFSWGDAWAGYDPKSGSSSIGIRYK